MPLPFLLNLWACNPWAAEPDRDAAQSQAQYSLAPYLPPIVGVPVPEPEPAPTRPRTDVPDLTYTNEEWFQSLSEHWEPKPPVIPADLHVSKSMADKVAAFVGRSTDSLECFHYAAYQMHVAGFRTTQRPSKEPRNFQILIEHRLPDGSLVEEVQVEAAIEAVLYIKEALHQDIPVLVGICIKGYPPRPPNNVESTSFVEPTNHFVVIVGMDKGNYGEPYFQYYDYYHHPESRDGQKCLFYLKPSMKLEWTYGGVMMAEVRRTLAL